MLQALKPLAMIALLAGPAGLARAESCIQNASRAVWYLMPTGNRVWVEVRVGPSLAALGPPRRVLVGDGLSVLALRPGTTMTLEVILEHAAQATAHFGLMDSELHNTGVIVSVWQGWLQGSPREMLVVGDGADGQASPSIPGLRLDARRFRIDKEGYGQPAGLASRASATSASSVFSASLAYPASSASLVSSAFSAFSASSVSSAPSAFAGVPEYPDTGLSAQILQAFHQRHALYLRGRASQRAGGQGEPSGLAGPGGAAAAAAASASGSLSGLGMPPTPPATSRPAQGLGVPQLLGPSAYAFSPPSPAQPFDPFTFLLSPPASPGQLSHAQPMATSPLPYLFTPPGSGRSQPGLGTPLEGPAKRNLGAMSGQAGDPEDSPPAPKRQRPGGDPPHLALPPPAPAPASLSPQSLYVWNDTLESQFLTVHPGPAPFLLQLGPEALPILVSPEGPKVIRLLEPKTLVRLTPTGEVPIFQATFAVTLPTANGDQQLHTFLWELQQSHAAAGSPRYLLRARDGAGNLKPLDAVTAPCWNATNLFTVHPRPTDRPLATLPPRHPGIAQAARNPVAAAAGQADQAGANLSPAPGPAGPSVRIPTLGIINDGDRTWTLGIVLGTRALMVRSSKADGQDGPLLRLAPATAHTLAILAGGMLLITGTEPCPDMLLRFSLGRHVHQGHLALESFLWRVTPGSTGDLASEGTIELSQTSHHGQDGADLPLPPDMSWDGHWVLTLH